VFVFVFVFAFVFVFDLDLDRDRERDDARGFTLAFAGMKILLLFLPFSSWFVCAKM
jgi:hypothetical protein